MYIKPKPLRDYPWFLRRMYQKQEKMFGEPLLPGLFWGRFPYLQILFLSFWKYLDRKGSSIDPAIRSLIQVRAAQVNWCRFCIDYNSLIFSKRTNTEEKLEQLENWKKSDLFSDQECATLAYTDIVSGNEIKIPEELIAKLKSFYSDDQIVEITALISFQNMSAKFNAALHIPSQGLCTLEKKT